jgi:hypothetical protein
MAEKFDIIEFLSGLTNYVFDKAVLKTIALGRDVMDVTSYDELDKKTIELLEADLLYKAYYSPNVWASATQSHGSYTRTIGSQTIYEAEKERILARFTSIYKKYDDKKLEEVNDLSGTLQWLDI